MQYAILVYESPEALERRDAPETDAAYLAYTRALADAGVLRGGEALEHPLTATTVTVARGRTEIHDGPYADTREQLGGLFVIEVDDLDQALAWAALCPAATTGRVEVRPTRRPPR